MTSPISSGRAGAAVITVAAALRAAHLVAVRDHILLAPPFIVSPQAM